MLRRLTPTIEDNAHGTHHQKTCVFRGVTPRPRLFLMGPPGSMVFTSNTIADLPPKKWTPS